MSSERNKSFHGCRKSSQIKTLLVIIIVLLASLSSLVYLYLSQRQNGDEFYGKERGETTKDKPKICTERNCVLNAADLLRKMDPTVDPCHDFYSYACGGYDVSTPIPAHLNHIHVLQQLQDENKEFLKTVIENPRIRAKYSENRAAAKLFHSYDMCMDSNKLEGTAMRSLKKFVAILGGSNITSERWDERNYDIFSTIAEANRLNFNLFFGSGVWINPQNSSKHIFFISNPISGVKTTGHESELLYREYMITMMQGIAANPSDIADRVDEVIKVEKRIAKILSRYRFHSSHFSTMTFRELSRHSKFDWLSFFRSLAKDVGYIPQNEDAILVESRAILRHVLNVIKTTEKHVLSNFIAWKILEGSLAGLPRNFSATQHKFKNSVRRKSVEEAERWKTCIEILSGVFQKVFSFIFVDQRFSETSRQKAFEVFHEIRDQFIENLKSKTWMDRSSKKAAEKKAKRVNFLVGYSDEVKNIKEMNRFYRELHVNQSNFFDIYLNLRRFLVKSNIKKLLRPVQKNAFDDMTSNANAYYSRQENKISFMAGILQRPIYDSKNSRASNYGSLGMIVGHELTHAFDSKSHEFDSNGEAKNWWTPYSLRNFHRRKECFVEQYNKFTIHGERVRGRSTLPENIADNGGIKLAFKAYKRHENRDENKKQLPGLHLTNDQVFFLSFAQVWCSKYRKDALADVLQNRVPMMFRVTGSLRNSVEFSQAYRCPLGSQMNPKRKCEIW